MLSLGLLQIRDEIINGKLTKAAPSGINGVKKKKKCLVYLDYLKHTA